MLKTSVSSRVGAKAWLELVQVRMRDEETETGYLVLDRLLLWGHGENSYLGYEVRNSLFFLRVIITCLKTDGTYQR